MARILLVDDERVARALYGDYLTSVGHTVTAVNTLAAAREALNERPYDAVVTDLILPGGNGMEVLRHVKENYPGVEVIVITALDKVDPAVRAIKSGAAEYLVKPVTPEALQHAVTRSLATRHLLRENEQLRRYVQLTEAGQRIATTLDRGRLINTTCHSFSQAAGAQAVVVYLRQGSGEFQIEGAHGVQVDSEADLVSALNAKLAQPPTEIIQVDKLPGKFSKARIVPARDENVTWGFVVLLFQDHIPDDSDYSAGYLAENLGLALRNLGKFAEVEDLAYLDDLTHLFNVRYLDLVLEQETKSAGQGGNNFTLLFLDLDYFKNVNDTHGHLVGSKLLVEVARVMKSCIRDKDVAVRYGGDEYVLLLRGTDSGGGLKVAERIRRTIETHQFLAREGYGLSITTCIGVASFPEHAQDKQTLLDLADRAMYRGKKGTRNIIYMAASGLEATPSERHSTPTG
jgi:diguanylate cyclase (GGDEF)-like protein